NVRELENVVERALVLSHAPVMTPDDLPQYLTSGQKGAHPAQQSVLRGETKLNEAVDQLEQDLIHRTLSQTQYNQTRAAELLGPPRRILKYKMDKLGMVGEGEPAQ